MMKCEDCNTELELLAEGGRYSRFGWRASRSHHCPKCGAVYDTSDLRMVRVKSDIPDFIHGSASTERERG